MAVKQHIKQKPAKKSKGSSMKRLAPKSTENFLDEADSEVKLAYNTFINARNELSEAVKEQEDQGKQASINVERRYQAYRLIIEQAFKEKGETESQAFEAYRESVLQANKVYRDKLDTLLVKCKSITANAWEASLDMLKTSPNGEIIHPSGVWPTTKNNFQAFITRTGNFFIKAFRNTKKFNKIRINIFKTTNAQSCRLKLK